MSYTASSDCLFDFASTSDGGLRFVSDATWEHYPLNFGWPVNYRVVIIETEESKP